MTTSFLRCHMAVILVAALVFAFDQARGNEELDRFEKEIRPLFAAKCAGCHGAKKSEGGLRLDRGDAARRGGDSGMAIVTGDAKASLLVKAVRRDGDLKMPPEPDPPLSPREIAALEQWIDRGAYWPDEQQAQTGVRSGPITDRDKSHWSFQPIRLVSIPTVANQDWPLTAIDHFVLAALEREGIAPSPAADRRGWLRRVTFDLTGLPPTPEEIGAFVGDASPDAFEKVVERLLASPAYGERWGRRWLDVVRYADTAGDGSDYPVREAYKYRDYVIRSFSADKPFDRFVVEQLAGDILARDEPDPARYAECVTATGYIAIGKRYGYNAGPTFQHLDIADTLDNVGQTFTGLTLGCARCHDHKYEPLTIHDYYALYGIFQSTVYSFPGGEEQKRPAHLQPLVRPEIANPLDTAHNAQLQTLADQIKRLNEEKAAAEKEAVAHPPESALAKLTRESATRLGEAAAALDRQRNQIAVVGPGYDVAYAVREGSPRDAPIQKRGEPDRLGEPVPRRFFEVLGSAAVQRAAEQSGRLDLAEWLVDREHPLTARVFVNRVWQWHFGEGLVRTPNDFGTRGERPSHPELLDWLATRFVDDGWSLKSLHRLIVLSQTYRQASSASDRQLALDPDNRWLSRFPRQSLDAETLRDAMLFVSGRLDRTIAGPHPFPPVETWGFTIHNPFAGEYPSQRRSVYLMTQRLRRHSYLAMFDGADPNLSTPQRRPGSTPLQALFLLNSPFTTEAATGLAERLNALADNDAARVSTAFEMVFGRVPQTSEQEAAVKFVEQYASLPELSALGDAERRRAAWTALSRALLAGNGFLFVD